MRLTEISNRRLLEDENYFDNKLLGRDFDAVILVGSHEWPRLSDIYKVLKIENCGSEFSVTVITIGEAAAVEAVCDRLGYAASIEDMKKIDVISIGSSTLIRGKMLPKTARYILEILLDQGRQEVIVSGAKDGLLKIVECLRNLILEDSILGNLGRYRKICLYAVPLPLQLEPREVE